MKNKIGKGALILLASGLICKVLGALFRLPLTNLIGIEGIGVFQLVMALYSFALVITCGGITTSLSKLISSARARKDYRKIKTYLSRALIVGVGIGFALGVVFLIFGKKISLFQGIESNNSYYLFVFLLPLGAGLSALRGFFQGYENMLPTAVSQVVEQVFKFAFGLLFAFFFAKKSVANGVFGAFLGITLSEVVALLFLSTVYLLRRKKHFPKFDLAKLKFARKEFDMANFPLTLSASILPLVNAFDGLVIVPRLVQAGFSNSVATQLFGLQSGVVGAILNFPLIISMAVTTALLPNISYTISRGIAGRTMVEKGFRALFYLILPTTFGVVAISKQVFDLVYVDMSAELLEIAFNLMLFGAFSIIFTAVMQYLVMLLQANGQFSYILIITSIGGLVKAVLSYSLAAVSAINIFALVVGNIALMSIVSILALIKLKRLMIFKINFLELFNLIFATALMFLTVYTFINCNYFSSLANIVLAVLLGVLVYFVFTLSFLIKMKKVSKKEY
ncbi:MAG: hypothetical protein E7375_00660 [Clostridiales bacterium]|nr:hypothetical protein [Clostridiales bacterium]